MLKPPDGLGELGVELARLMFEFAASAHKAASAEDAFHEARKQLDLAKIESTNAEKRVLACQTKINEQIAATIKGTKS